VLVAGFAFFLWFHCGFFSFFFCLFCLTPHEPETLTHFPSIFVPFESLPLFFLPPWSSLFLTARLSSLQAKSEFIYPGTTECASAVFNPHDRSSPSVSSRRSAGEKDCGMSIFFLFPSVQTPFQCLHRFPLLYTTLTYIHRESSA